MALVQRGTITIPAGEASAEASLVTPVPVGQSWWLSSSRGTENNPVHSMATLELTNVVEGHYTKVKATRDYTNGTCYVEWQVVSGEEFSVQSGVCTMSGSSYYQSISSVDLTKSFSIISVRTGIALVNGSYFQGRLTSSSTQLGLFTSDKEPYTFGLRSTISWQVITWEGANVQSFSVNSSGTTITNNISTVDPAKTFVLHTFRTTAIGYADEVYLRSRIYDDGGQWKVELRRGTGNYDFYAGIYVISHDDINVQSYLENTDGGTILKEISEVDLLRSFAVNNYQGNAYIAASGVDLIHGRNTHRLSAANTYEVKREGTSGSIYACLQIVTFLILPPDRPTGLSPNGTYFPGGEAKQFTWQHNPASGEVQSHYEIQYRIQGAGTWTSTGKIASATSSHTFLADTFVDGEEYEWQVRTWSQGCDNPGDWSFSAVFTCYTRPTATITFPADDSYVHTSGKITTVWEFYQAQGNTQAAYRLKLYSSHDGVRGVLLWDSMEVASIEEYREIDYILTEDQEYQVGLTVKSSAGLWGSEVYRTFITTFISPAKPSITLMPDNDAAAIAITVTNPEPDPGEPEVTHNDIYRREPGGEWIRIIRLVETNGTAIDYTPGHEVVYEYKAVAHGTNYGTSESDPASSCVSFHGWILLTPVDSPTEGVRVRYNITRPMDLTPDITLHHFAGRKRPVRFTGEAVSRAFNITFDLNAGEEESLDVLDALEAMAESGETVLYRSAHARKKNRRVFGVIKKLSLDDSERLRWTVNILFEEVDHKEAI